jgi:hypothetical protein
MVMPHWSQVPVHGTEPGSPITVVARTPGHLDLFVTGFDSGTYSTFWDDASGWGGWFQVSGGAAKPGSPITAVTRTPDHLDLFVVGTDTGIYSTWWDAASGWASWFQVSGGAAALGSPSTAIARNPNHLDLFVVGTDGSISSTVWDAASGWASWFQVSGVTAPLGSPVTAVARTPDHLDLFVTDANGSIRSTFWDAASGWASWFSVSGGAAKPGSPITALARTPNHLDLYVTGTDGRIYTTHLRADSTWQRWSPVPGLTTALGAWITAVPRTTDQVKLFATDDGAAIFSTPLPYEWELFPPQPPTGLHVTEVGDRKLGVAWKDRSNNEDGFIIRYRGERPRFGDHTGSLSVRKNTQAAALARLRSGLEYTIHVVAVNAAGESGGPSVTATTPARTISVAKEGAGLSSVFVVKGTGFSPNSKVFLQIAHGFELSEWVETAEGDGTLTSRHSYPCVTGQELTVSAFESADPLGTESNYLETSCP